MTKLAAHQAHRILLAIIAVVVTALPAVGADPFYEQLLRKGTDASNRGDYQGAARALRIACFGFLDDPKLLALGLTRLALAQTASGDTVGFGESVARITEVEQRFGAWEQAQIPVAEREALERAIVRVIPAAVLSGNPVFGRLVASPEQRLAHLPERQRRHELERLAKQEPGNAEWRVRLAALELASGNARDAAREADAALRIDGGNQDARLLRGLALAAEGRWRPAIEDLKLVRDRSEAQETLMRALVETEQWDQAIELFAGIPDAQRSDALARLVDRARAGREESQASTSRSSMAAARPEPTPEPSPGPATPPAVSQSPARPSATPTPPPAESPTSSPRPTPTATPTPPPTPSSQPTGNEQEAMREAERLAAANRLADAFVLASEVADRHPTSRDAQLLAAELAYRTARWDDALRFFTRAGDPGNDQPLRLFYLAVTLYESGDRAGAASALTRSLGGIRRTPYVESYVAKILGESGKPRP